MINAKIRDKRESDQDLHNYYFMTFAEKGPSLPLSDHMNPCPF